MHTSLIIACLFVAAIAPAAFSAGRDADWKAVDEAVSKGLPKTAIAALDKIIPAAIADKAYAEAVKAIGRKIALEGNIQGNKPEEKIVRLEAELARAPAEMKPLMEAILGHWYWQYYQRNRWRFMHRTETAEAPGPDIKTWDLPRILSEIGRHFDAALADEVSLKATPVATFDALLEKGNLPDTYRPTLYDFLAHEALRFYCTGEQGALAAEDAFVLEADSPILAPAAAFVAWQPDTGDETSPTLKAIRLYQKLLEFHANDTDKTAFIDADLERLDFGHNQAVGEDKDDRYVTALKRFVDEWGDSEIAARALAEWAEILNGKEERVEARKLAQRGLDVFPKSTGGAMCYNLIQRIEARSASIETERVWNDPPPTIDVTYRNVTKVYFRAVPSDFAELIKSRRWGLYNLDRNQRDNLLRAKPVLAWDAELPPTTDYLTRTETLPAPKGLAPGFYFIIASHDKSFGSEQNQVSIAPVWVSTLALVVRAHQAEALVDGFVLDARSGSPIAGAIVRAFTRNNNGWLRESAQATTDANGVFAFPNRRDWRYLMVAEADGQRVATDDESSIGSYRAEERDHHTVFFTDRALYRPGQTIYYKGIHFRVDREKDTYETIAGEEIAVEFLDVNGKEIARATHVSNDYGSFDGAFTAPRDRLMGRMRIVHRNKGETVVNVEEYKRPKFQVELAAPKDAAKLDASVSVTGKATAYTGAAVGGAKVKWRVEREPRFPPWCWWWWGHSESRAIAHGIATTETDGSFSVAFTARADRSIPAKDEPTFEFHIYADVTDTTGETRSDERTVCVGYTALRASLDAADWQTPAVPVTLTVTTESLDREPRAATGSVKVYELKQPADVARGKFGYRRPYGRDTRGGAAPETDPTNPDTWELGRLVVERPFQTDAKGRATPSAPLAAGVYRAMLETKDAFGKAVTARLTLQVVDPKATTYSVKLANHFASPAWSVEPGETFVGLWGTGYANGRAYVELEHRGRTKRAYWTAPDRTQEIFEQDVTAAMRGGFTVRVTYVRENRAYLNSHVVDVPWSNKELDVKWEHFTSKLTPGQKETWTAVIAGPKATRAAAEMVAALYDASLDQMAPHDWIHAFGVFRREQGLVRAEFANAETRFQHILGRWSVDSRGVLMTYRSFPSEITASLWGYGYFNGRRGVKMARIDATAAEDGPMMLFAAAPAAPMAEAPAGMVEKAAGALEETADFEMIGSDKADGAGGGGEAAPKIDLGKVAARKNLNETAFFFPHLLSDSNGVVRMTFTMPEAMTEWKFLGFAHDRELRGGYLTDKVVTAKDLMVEPNAPRFVREGDAIEFTVKVSNQTDTRQTGKVRLTLSDARTLTPVDEALGNRAPELDFELPAKESRSYAWRLTIPDGMGFLTYTAVGATATMSDGEEGYLPVLSRRILVQESLPLPVRGKQTKAFAFDKLLASGASDTLRNQSLTVQMVSQPAWYAVMALPYLMEYPYECSEQVFNRLYANALARYIAASDPKIRRVFDQWKGTPALDSPLEKNADLKSVMLEETPWVREAEAESQARRKVGLLFDENRLDDETARTLRKLTDMQLSDGLWPWFPGGRPNPYISLYIVTGFGRLRQLGVDIVTEPAVKALAGIDAWMDEQYHDVLERGGNKDDNHLNHTIAFYLYGRGFFVKDAAVADLHREALEYWMGQARRYWLDLACRQSQAHIALGLQRFGDAQTPRAIMRSIRERSVSDEELGMFWRELELSWWWYRAPIETQATMIEAFDEIEHDARAVEDCKVWLLKQKQTQDWKTTKATADAVYALLRRGMNLLASDELVEVSLGGTPIKPTKVEAGTGFYEQRFAGAAIKPAMGNITVTKKDEGVSWGAVHWQYLEDMTKITPYEGTPLKLKKSLYVKETTAKGPVLTPVTGPVAVGDELVVRIELRTDRDMEYVHMKDQRGSGTEPVSVLSRYRYQDGLAYYESTRDTAGHFFIDYLPKGVYVFEYSTRIQLRGTYQTGVATIECMYAPEFNSHSESMTLDVR